MIVGIDVDFGRMNAVRVRGSLGKVRFARHRVICFRDGGGVALLKNYTTNSDGFHNFVEQSNKLSWRCCYESEIARRKCQRF